MSRDYFLGFMMMFVGFLGFLFSLFVFAKSSVTGQELYFNVAFCFGTVLFSAFGLAVCVEGRTIDMMEAEKDE